MITKETLMAAAIACTVSVTPMAFAADVTGVDGNPATDLTVDAPLTTINGEVEIDGNNGGIPEILLSPGGDGSIVVQDNSGGGERFKVLNNGDVSTEGTLVVKGTALVNDTLTVQPENTTMVVIAPPVPGSGVATDLGGVMAGTGGPVKEIITVINTFNANQVTDSSEGFVAETNGNATLNSVSTTTTDVNYGRAVTQEVAQTGNANPVGVAIPGTEMYFATNAGTGAIISPGFATPALLDAWIASQTPESLLVIDPTLGTQTTDEGSGGNLVVEGNSTLGNEATDVTTVNGVLKVDTVQDLAGNNLIRRDGDGSIHIGDGSFSIDTVNANHTLTTNSGTKIILGGDNPLTVANEDKDIEVANNLNVVGNTTLTTVTATGLASLDGGINVNDDFTVDVNGNTALLNGAGLNVTGNTTLTTVTATGLASLDGGINVNDDFTVDVNGNTALLNGAGLNVTGNTTLTTVTATGLASLDGGINVNDDFTVDVNGNTDIDGTLDVAGLASLDGGINVNDDFQVDANGNTDIDGNLDVDGFTTTDGLRNDGQLTNNGNVDINGNTDISGVLSLGDNGFGGVDDVARRINQNANNIANNKRDIQTNTRGIAMVAAMTNTTVLPGNTQAIDFNLSHFEGETGFGFGYARAINPNLQLKIAVASTTDFEESVVRAGVSYQW